jgi:hypothetical protein
MSGRHRFSEIEATMAPARRARIREMSEKLDADVAHAPEPAPPRNSSQLPLPGESRDPSSRFPSR